MDVIKQARELGKAIQADEKFIRFAKAKLANDDNTELQEAIARFHQIRSEIENASASDEKDGDRVRELNETLRKAYSEIMSSPAMVEYNAAKAELDKMVMQVNTIIARSIEGENPETCETSSGCTGSCATCGGCG